MLKIKKNLKKKTNERFERRQRTKKNLNGKIVIYKRIH